MHSHHTKDKGDLAVAKAFADLVSKGYMVLLPTTEHAPFDLVAYLDGRFLRVQVKYRSAPRGSFEVKFQSVWSDRNGVHRKASDKSAVDVFCVYCPDTDECYYLRPMHHGTSATIRIVPSRNGQTAGVLRANDYLQVPEIGSV